MKIQLLNNKRGVIYGKNPLRISCDIGGALKINTSEIKISPEAESVMPILCNGCTGEFKAIFTDENGTVYELENVTIQGGRIVPPPQIVADFMELKCKEEAIEKEFAELKAQFDELSHRFDNNSLNFLIK